MKIMFVCAGGLVAGKERQTFDFITYLRDNGHELYCITSSWGDGEFSKALTSNNIPHQRLRLGYITTSLKPGNIKMTLHQLMYVPLLWSKYRKALSSFQPDVVVHTNLHHVLLLLPVFKNEKNVFHVHEIYPPSVNYKRLFRLFDKHLEAFIGVSKYVCNSLLNLDLPSAKVKLVYNGIRPSSPVHRLPSTSLIIGVVGQIGSWKGHDILIDSLHSLLHLSWKLNIVGAGEPSYVASLKEKISKLGMNDRVEFVGRRDGIENIYRDLDIVCVPSLFNEPFGLVAAEPGFFEIPVVVTDRGGLPEIVINNETGIIVPAGNSEALAAALSTLITDPDKRRRYGISAREHVKKSFSIDAAGSLMAKTLHNLPG